MSYFRRALFAPRASVLTIDTNPPPVFGRCGATAETLALEGTLSDLAKQAYALTSAEIELMWKTAALRMPTPRPFEPGWWSFLSRPPTTDFCLPLSPASPAWCMG